MFFAVIYREQLNDLLPPKVEGMPLENEANRALGNASRDLWSGLIAGGIAAWFLFF